MPLFQIVMWEVGRRISQSDAWLRAPSAVAGTAAIYVAYRLGKDLQGVFAGAVCGALMAFLPFPLWYSQEARPYAFLILFVGGQLLFALRALRTGALLDFSGLATCTILAIYTHYTGLLATVGVAVAAMVPLAGGLKVARGLRRLGLATLTGAVVALAYLPWLPTLIAFLTGPASARHLDVGAGQESRASDLLSSVAAFGFAGPLAILALAGLVYCGIRLAHDRSLLYALPPIALLLPLAVLLLPRGGAGFVLWPRYLAFLFPDCLLLSAVGAHGLVDAVVAARGSRLRLSAQGVAGGLLILFAVPAGWSSLSWPKDGYREASAQVLAQARSGSLVLFVGPNTVWLDQAVPRYVSVGWPSESAVEALQVADLDHDAEAQRRLRVGQGDVFLILLTRDDPYGLRTEHLLEPGDQMLDYRSLPHGPVVMQRFIGVTVVRCRDTSLSSREQTLLLLGWAQAFDPSVDGVASPDT